MNYSDDEEYEGEIDGVENMGTANLTGPRSASITFGGRPGLNRREIPGWGIGGHAGPT